MARGSNRVWLLLAALSLGDLVWGAASGLRLSHWRPLALGVLALFAIMLFYRLSGRSARIAAMAEAPLQWIVFSIAGAVLTYLAAAHAGPLCDRELAAADAALGFDWNAWFAFVNRHPAVKFPLAFAYGSLMAQIVLSALWFAWRGADSRNGELLTHVIAALAVTAAVSWRLPAVGPGAGVPAIAALYLDDFLGLRAGSLHAFDVMKLQGIVVFPSFHATLAALFSYAHRGSRLFLPVAALNAVMLVSIPSEGGHYLVDLFAGLAVAAGVVLVLRGLPLPTPALARRRQIA